MHARKCRENRHRSPAAMRGMECAPEILREFTARSGDDARMPCSLDAGDIIVIARPRRGRRFPWMHP
jgi:hypothetical protein